MGETYAGSAYAIDDVILDTRKTLLTQCFEEDINNTKEIYNLPNLSDIHLLNITQDVPFEYAMPLFGYIMPSLLLVTIVANTLIVVVLAQRHMRTPTNLLLLAMAISDLLTLLFPAPWYFYMYTLGNYNKLLFPPAACYSYHYMYEVIPAFFHTASIWLTLVLAVHRYIYVCYPTTAHTWCTVSRVTRAMIFVYVLAFLHQSTRIFDRVFLPVEFRWQGKAHMGCVAETARWVGGVLTQNIYYICYYVFRIIFVHVGPCATLVVLNILLFRAMKEAQRKRKRLFNENSKSEYKRQRESSCTTLMLIVVVTVFLAVEIPLAVTSLLHVMRNALNLDISNYNDLNATILFTNFFIMLSYPFNFAIYCGMSRQFRETFKDLFMVGFLVNRRWSSSRYSMVNGPRTTTNETVL
ncbi:sex peptide receptor-like [Limulus polyphemus]|uniref:Sex peptide receptor-like n=1 Tax=Limulus polyphemus TaxID=6850 RepID=A0ABM1BJY5_LIMPO|nr:sex peptide receptor-like [Limulus polyphemus]